MNEPQLFTLEEVATTLRVSKRTVQRLVAAGRIRPVRIGARTLVSDRELAAFVAAAERRRLS